MIDLPFFSIITPVFNRADLVGETIESVLKQDFKNFELILIDDGSTDNSVEVITDYVKNDSRIKLINLESNKGRCIARNIGIEKAKGIWICHLDSDDLFYENHLSHFYKVIHENPSFNAFAVNQNLNHILVKDGIMGLDKDQTIWTIEHFIENNPLTANQLCYSNQIPIRWANERIPISEDWLFMRNLVINTSILKFSKVTVNLRDHDNRTVKLKDEGGVDDFVKFNIYTANKFIDDNKINKSIKNRIISHTLLLCCNVYLSNKLKKKAIPFFLQSLKFFKTYQYKLFYKAIIKFLN